MPVNRFCAKRGENGEDAQLRHQQAIQTTAQKPYAYRDDKAQKHVHQFHRTARILRHFLKQQHAAQRRHQVAYGDDGKVGASREHGNANAQRKQARLRELEAHGFKVSQGGKPGGLHDGKNRENNQANDQQLLGISIDPGKPVSRFFLSCHGAASYIFAARFARRD